MRTTIVSLGDVAEIVSGATPKTSVPDFWDGDIPWATPADLSKLSGKEISVTARYLTIEGLSSCSSRVLPAGSVLLSSRAPIGHVAINAVPMATNQGFKSLIPDERFVASDYLYWWLKSNTVFLQSLGRGATFKEISKQIVEDVKIHLPPLEEQRRIAAILDKANQLQAMALRQKDIVRQAEQHLFLEIFGSPWAQETKWSTVKLSELGLLDRGVSKHRPRNDSRLLGGAYPFIQTGDVAGCDGVIESFKATYSEFGLQQSRLWPKGTLCITIAANIAKTGILAFDACFPDSVVGFSGSGPAIAWYVQVWLSFLQGHLERMAPESAQKNINLEILRSLEIPFPPSGLVDRFYGQILAAREVFYQQKVRHSSLAELRGSLQSYLLVGDL